MIFKGLKKALKTALIILLMVCLTQTTLCSTYIDLSKATTSHAHSGRTDKSGGHKDNKNASGLGSYHYHCGGYSAHLHKNGICPYSTTTTKKSTQTTKSTTKKSVTKSEIKSAQEKLNDLGYACGTPDGVIGEKTKKAIRSFQKDKGLKVDGTLNSETMKRLGI